MTISAERLKQLACRRTVCKVSQEEIIELAERVLKAESNIVGLKAEPVAYLTWHQGFLAPDDCQEYVVVAAQGDKSCDGTPAFPVFIHERFK